MIKVPVRFVYMGIFTHEGKKWKIKGCANSRILCHEVDDPTKEMQFSSYSAVEVEDAQNILFIANEALHRTRSDIVDLEECIRSLKSQGVKEKF
jgi:hypothetical protein